MGGSRRPMGLRRGHGLVGTASSGPSIARHRASFLTVLCSWPPALISVGTTALLCGYLHLDHPPRDPSNVPIPDPTSGGWNVTQLLCIIDAPIAWDVIERYARLRPASQTLRQRLAGGRAVGSRVAGWAR